MIYSAKNSRFNREANVLEKLICLLAKKNGIAYFAILENGEKNIFCSCEETLFEKEFYLNPDAEIPFQAKVLQEQTKYPNKKIFKRYPADLKNKT